MKNKILGFVVFSFGLVQSAFPVVVYYAVIPRLYKLYTEMDVIPPKYGLINIGMLFLLVYGLINILVGTILLLGKGNLDKWFKMGAVLFIANFVLGGLISGLVMIGIITPIYSLGTNY